MSEIWGIILAAGESKRMGKQKLLLPFGEKTILGSTIDNAIGSELNDVLVVLGSDSTEIFDLIRYLPVRICYNDRYKLGMLSSVQCGIRALPPECEAVMVFPGDQHSWYLVNYLNLYG
jgi:molybdenum cofactor cytidylyltransferase